ncbi:RDD family protein [Moraxella sp. ZY200743]|uniref:RDD family protein n=1 Tax=Moraxella sp. ZY200743 TaxID=2911970 RepID=UPI003D7DB9C1
MSNTTQPTHLDHPAYNQTIYRYAGFWIRFVAQLVDGILFLLISLPLLYLVYGDAYFDAYFSVEPTQTMFFGVADILISVGLPLLATFWFWTRKGATPGKMLLGLQVLDERTGNLLTLKQAFIRYLGYIVSSVVFGLGYIWAGFDKKKQSWHDKLAKTVVVRKQ